ncbi:unnamed protein product, partial [marine sediment metagenome]
GNMALFAVYNADSGKGGIYSYGRKNKNHPFVLNLDYQFDADELGAVVSVDGVAVVSYKDGANYGVKAVDSTAKAIGIYEGLDFPPSLKKPIHIDNWKYVEITCKPLPDGSSIEFWFKLNKYGNFIRAKMESGSDVFRARDETKAVFLIAEDAKMFEPRVVLNPIGNISPEVIKIEVFFD